MKWKDVDYTPYTSTTPYSSEEESIRQEDFIQKLSCLVREMAERSGRVPTACVVTFGCQMNARDSEKLSGILSRAGYMLTEDEEADLVVYNTCTVRDNANQRVYGRLGHLNAMKKLLPTKKIALCGCMVQEVEVIEKIRRSYSFVDLIFGTHNIYKFPELLYMSLTSDKMIVDVWKATDQIVEDLPIERKYRFKSGVNIMFGCDKFCTYCIVPYVRGRERSRDPKEILNEIEHLAADGVSEVMLLGQNVDSYGKGLEQGITFPKLLSEVEKVDGIRRIRFMTSHPRDLSDELIALMADSDKICSHLHLPVQSGSNRILKAMNRGYTRESYMDLVGRLRKAMPELALTTDIIVGFPGETPEDIEETISLVKEAEYDNAFTFIYSPRTGTPAAEMPRSMSDEEIKAGFDKLLKTVQDTARKRVARYAGRCEEALVEGLNDHDKTMVTGRLSNNLLVHFKAGASLIGSYVNVRLLENKGFYYIGEML